jgi:hypothetical protein
MNERKENKDISAFEFDVIAADLFESAEKIHKSLDYLSKFHDKIGFSVSVAKKDRPKIKTKSIGKPNDINEHLSHGQAFLQQDALRVGVKETDKIIPGTVVVGDLVINVHGTGEMDFPIAIGTLFGAKIVSYAQTEQLAHKYNCVSLYMENRGAITDPFFENKPLTEVPLLPPQDI